MQMQIAEYAAAASEEGAQRAKPQPKPPLPPRIPPIATRQAAEAPQSADSACTTPRTVSVISAADRLINGLYQLAKVVHEEQNGSLARKIAAPRGEYHNLCQDCVPGSCRSGASSIKFAKLDGVSLQPCGLMGPSDAIVKYLMQHCSLPAEVADQLSPAKRPPEGLYLWCPTLAAGDRTASQAAAGTGALQCYIIVWPGHDSFQGAGG